MPAHQRLEGGLVAPPDEALQQFGVGRAVVGASHPAQVTQGLAELTRWHDSPSGPGFLPEYFPGSEEIIPQNARHGSGAARRVAKCPWAAEGPGRPAVIACTHRPVRG